KRSAISTFCLQPGIPVFRILKSGIISPKTVIDRPCQMFPSRAGIPPLEIDTIFMPNCTFIVLILFTNSYHPISPGWFINTDNYCHL
ncbi:hypothetical protein N9219_04275, partial [bacterium]|nr:hypothetical protein [bacterium]